MFADPTVPPVWTRRTTLLLLVLLALAAALQLTYVQAWQAREPLADAPHGDELAWLAESRLHFRQRADVAYDRPPAYSELLWALQASEPGGRERVRLAQVALGLVALGGAFVLAQRRAGDFAAALALVVALAFAPLTFHATKLLETTLALAAATAGCVALDRALRVGCWRAAGASGLLLGLASTTWGGWLPVALVGGAVLGWRQRRAALGFAVALALPVAPLLVHNARTGGAPAVSFADGRALFAGNHADARGTLSPPPGFPADTAAWPAAESDLARAVFGREPTPAERSAWSRGQALRWIAAHPASAAALLRDKLRWLVSSQELTDGVPLAREQQRFGLLPWARLPFLALAAAGLFGLALARARPRLALALPATGVALVLLATSVDSRHRVLLVPFLAAGAGLAGAWLVELVRGRTTWRPALVPAAVAAVPLLLALALPLPIDAQQLRAADAARDIELDAHAARVIGATDPLRAARILGRTLADHPRDEQARVALPGWLDTQPPDERAALQRAAFEAAGEAHASPPPPR